MPTVGSKDTRGVVNTLNTLDMLSTVGVADTAHAASVGRLPRVVSAASMPSEANGLRPAARVVRGRAARSLTPVRPHGGPVIALRWGVLSGDAVQRLVGRQPG